MLTVDRIRVLTSCLAVCWETLKSAQSTKRFVSSELSSLYTVCHKTLSEEFTLKACEFIFQIAGGSKPRPSASQMITLLQY